MIKIFPLCLWAIVLIILTLLITNNVNGQLFRPGQEPQNGMIMFFCKNQYQSNYNPYSNQY